MCPDTVDMNELRPVWYLHCTGHQLGYGKCIARITWTTCKQRVYQSEIETRCWSRGTTGCRRGSLHIMLGTWLQTGLPSPASRPTTTAWRSANVLSL